MSATLAGPSHLLRAAARLQWDEAALDLPADVPPAPGSALRAELEALVAGFVVAEAAVAEHLLPFAAATQDAELAECFRVQARDEARHARFFARVAREVLGGALPSPTPSLARLFGRELPARATALAGGGALADAVGLYHLVLEGVVLQAGEAALLAVLDEAGTLPATREGVARVQADERWHVGLGVLALQRLGAPAPGLAALAGEAAAAWPTPRADAGRGRALLARRLRLSGA